MENQDTLPQLQFPTVPPNYCPQGTWPEILQSFIDQILVQGTVNIPGISGLDLADIASIQQTLINLQNQINANTATRRTGNQSVVSGVNTVTFSTAMPNNNYTPLFVLEDNGSASGVYGHMSLVPGSISTGGFQLRNDGVPTSWTLRYFAISN